MIIKMHVGLVQYTPYYLSIIIIGFLMIISIGGEFIYFHWHLKK